MAGISGVWSPNGESGKEAILPMLRPMTRSGRSCEVFSAEDMHLGVRSSESCGFDDGNRIVAVDGEVYNKKALCETSFSDDDSTERIVAQAYEEQGEDLFNELAGDYALALLDCDRSKLILDTGLANNKNFFYSLMGSDLIFASELKGLMQAGAIDPSIDRSSIGNLLTYGHVPAPFTLFEGLRRLPPGATAITTEAGMTLVPAGEPRQYPPIEDLPAAVTSVEQSLKGAINRRLSQSDDIGMMLSGGIDSALLTSYLDEMVSGPVSTFTVGFGEDQQYAHSVSEHVGTDHSEKILSADEMIGQIPKVLWWREYPSKDPGVSPLYHIDSLTDRTELIWGQGAEEVVMGRQDYVALHALSSVPRRQAISRVFHDATPPVRNRSKLHRMYNLLRSRGPAESFTTFRDSGPKDRQNWAASDVHVGNTSRVRAPKNIHHPCSQYGWTSLINGFLSDVFPAPERRLMSPFLDSQVLDTGYRISSRLHLRDGRPRYLLRKLGAKRLPQQVTGRGRDSWASQTRNVVLNNSSILLAIADRLQDRNIITESARTIVQRQPHRWGKNLWTLVNLELFLEIFIDEDFEEEPPGIDYFI